MNKKVLLADDSVTIQKVVKIILADDDYALHVADNGDAALTMAKMDRPDIVLADVYMPGKNGYELCAAIKQEPALAGVPVLLLSGTFEAFDESKALAAGADGWIAKPFESTALIEKIEGTLASSVSSVTLAETTTEVNAVQEPSAVEPDMWADLEEDTLAPESTEGFLADPTVGEGVTVDEVELEADGLWDDEPLLAQEEEASALVEEAGAEQEVQIDDLDFDEIDEVNFDDVDLTASDAAADSPEEEVLFLDESDLLIDDDAETDSQIETDTTAEEETFEFITIDDASEPEPSEEEVGASADDLIEESAILDPVTDSVLVEELVPVIEEEPAPVVDEEAVPVVEEEAVPVVEEEAVPVVEEEPVVDILPEPELSEVPDDAITSTSIEEPVATNIGAAVSGLSFFSNSSLISRLAGTQEAAPDSEAPVGSAVEPEPHCAAVSKEVVVDRVQALSEDELTAIVEQVAGKVIERLANTMLERIAWEVVPDLAESLIKQEISRITAAQD